MIMLHVTPKVYATVEAAEAVAAILNLNEEEGWTYSVAVDPLGTGKAMVLVFDETGFEVGPL